MSDEEKQEVVPYRNIEDGLHDMGDLVEAQKRIVELEMELKRQEGLLQRTFMVLMQIRQMDKQVLDEVASYLDRGKEVESE